MEYIDRIISKSILKGLQHYGVTVITGPRQSGKSTLCRHLFADYDYVNLEQISARELIASDPQGFIGGVSKGIVIDEAHYMPELFSYIQVEVDAHPQKHFVLTGSSNFALLENVTQSLAGRADLYTLAPFAMQELGGKLDNMDTYELLFRGLYPAAHVRNEFPERLYNNYYNTYIERDVRSLINVKNLSLFQLFIRLTAGRTGSEYNYSAIADETGVSVPTIKQWMSVLEASYIVFKLPPYYENISKRLSKMPKYYFYDTGILCFLLGIENPKQLETHPLRGAVLENLVVTEFAKAELNRGRQPNLFFYRDSRGTEIDLVRTSANELNFFEIKSSKTFNAKYFDNIKKVSPLFGERVTRSAVIYDGEQTLDSVQNGIYNYRRFLY